MPIKFKCNCGKVLSVPSKMAGKQGKCPACSNSLRVPTPKAKPTAAKPAAPAAPAPAPLGTMDSLFDDAGLVEKTGPRCPSCNEDIKPGTVVCTSCGTNLQTGEALQGVDAAGDQGPEFKNLYLQQAATNMHREKHMDSRRAKSAMPWWVLMSFLIGAISLCAAGIVIVDGRFGEPDPESTLIGKIQRLPVFVVLGVTAMITGSAINTFAHLSICFFAFTRSIGHGFGCLFVPLYSYIYGILNWADNKAPVKAIIMAIIFSSIGAFLIIQGGGFGTLNSIR